MPWRLRPPCRAIFAGRNGPRTRKWLWANRRQVASGLGVIDLDMPDANPLWETVIRGGLPLWRCVNLGGLGSCGSGARL